VRRRGVGTQVVRGEVRRAVELTSLHDDLLRAGQEPSTSVLELATVACPAEVAKALGCPPAPRCSTCAGCGSPTASHSR
jgi:DNA-binding GntR family transcriptional regulator